MRPVVPTSLILIDTQHALREALALLLAKAGVRVLGATDSVPDAMALAARLGPTVVMADTAADGCGGIDIVRRLIALPSAPAVVLYAEAFEPETVAAALAAGAHAIALRHGSARELVELLSAVGGGGAAPVGRVRHPLLGTPPGHPPPQAPPRTLSKRENEVIELLSRGLTGEQVAQELVVSSETVKTHVRNAMVKLEATTRVHAIAIAMRAGYITGPAAIRGLQANCAVNCAAARFGTGGPAPAVTRAIS